MEADRFRLDAQKSREIRQADAGVPLHKLEDLALPRGQQDDFLRAPGPGREVVLSPVDDSRPDEAVAFEAMEMVGQGAPGDPDRAKKSEALGARLSADCNENPLSDRGALEIMFPPATGWNRGQDDASRRQSVEAH